MDALLFYLHIHFYWNDFTKHDSTIQVVVLNQGVMDFDFPYISKA